MNDFHENKLNESLLICGRLNCLPLLIRLLTVAHKKNAEVTVTQERENTHNTKSKKMKDICDKWRNICNYRIERVDLASTPRMCVIYALSIQIAVICLVFVIFDFGIRNMNKWFFFLKRFLKWIPFVSLFRSIGFDNILPRPKYEMNSKCIFS